MISCAAISEEAYHSNSKEWEAIEMQKVLHMNDNRSIFIFHFQAKLFAHALPPHPKIESGHFHWKNWLGPNVVTPIKLNYIIRHHRCLGTIACAISN